jgi:hypothetical protein
MEKYNGLLLNVPVFENILDGINYENGMCKYDSTIRI